MLATPQDVDTAARRVVALGGRVIKPPYASYYHQWQAVLADPEDQVFRVSTSGLPDGAVAAARPV
jgi:predicted enzyme related to lactoylglutathione lyase